MIAVSYGIAFNNASSSDKAAVCQWLLSPIVYSKTSIKWDKSISYDREYILISGGFGYIDKNVDILRGIFLSFDSSIKITYGGLVYRDISTKSAWTNFKSYDNGYSLQFISLLSYIDPQSKSAWGRLGVISQSIDLIYGGLYEKDAQQSIKWDSVWTAKREVAYDTNPVVIIPGPPPTNEILQVYFIMHSLAVVVLPVRTEIDISSISLGIDIDAFAWTMSMQVLDGIELIRPDISGNKEIEINIDGYIWEFIVESYTENKKFGDNSWTVAGRSKTAYLANPYKLPISNTYTSLINAAQIVNNELVGSGFTATYNTVDWGINADAFSYQNLTAMQAIRRIADAVGGVILPHQSANSLIINPRYQASPWNWGVVVPKATITNDIIIGMSGNWQPKPDINGVYVGGNTVGVECFVKRTGTAGDKLAGQHVGNLITHQDVGREKGRNIISDRGKQEVVSVQLPVLPIGETPAIYECGDLLEINEGVAGVWRAMVLSINITAAVNNGAITAEQTVSLEKHYGEY